MGETRRYKDEHISFWCLFCLQEAKIVTKTIELAVDLNNYH
jgi:hypothetical protein